MGLNRNKNTKIKRIFAFITFSVFLIVILIAKDYLPKSLVHVPIHVRKKHPISKNYFLDAKNLKNKGLLINTTNCQIPNFSPWDSEVVSLIKKPKSQEDCKKNPSWSSVDGNQLFISRRNMKEDGYLYREISCCYRIIKRVVQSKHKYTKSADRTISHSSCIPISKVRTRISKEFILVECSEIPKHRTKYFRYRETLDHSSKNSSTKVLYQGFHVIPQPHRSSQTSEKILYWMNQNSSELIEDRPPNILIIGIDSTSRLNFRRQMKRTRKLLENMGAVEMLGYTKAGENTFPNFCPIFFGYSEKDLSRICYFDSRTKLDDCPSIYKRFDEAKYLTAHTEDVPQYSGFNYLKTGFVRQPVDYYSRPLFLSAKDHNHTYCLGHLTNDEAISFYIENVMEVGSKYNAPVFSFSWSTKISHDDFNGNQLSDLTYTRLLERLELNGHLNNTILIFMGDHGYRWGKIRETLVGYYEDKLPNMWIRLPSSIKSKFPLWHEALHQNSMRLTSPFTLYWTLNLILDTFTNTPSPINSVDYDTEDIIYREVEQNFFEAVPEANSCTDVGVPEKFCACFPIKEVDLKDAILMKAAATSILKINEIILGTKCSPFKLHEITAGALFNKTTSIEGTEKLRYLIGFTTSPGKFSFEAEVNYFPENKTFSSDLGLQRASKIVKKFVKCVNDSKLELFCYCKS